MTKDEALKKAFAALNELCPDDYGGYELSKQKAYLVNDALTAVKEALEKQENYRGARLVLTENGVEQKGFMSDK